MRKAKTALCLITATGLTFHAFNPNFLSSSSDSFPNFPEKLRAPIHGVNRSSRAIATVRFLPFHSPFLSFFFLKKKKFFPFRLSLSLFIICSWKLQIAFTAVDYKFTLHGLSVDSDEYRQKLSEVGCLVAFLFFLTMKYEVWIIEFPQERKFLSEEIR